MSKGRKIAIWLIVLLPLVVLILLVAPFLFNWWNINHPDVAKIARSLETHLQSKLVPESDLQVEKLARSENDGKQIVYFFGGSSLRVMWEQEEGVNPSRFPEYFEQWTENIQVMNYGANSFDSYLVLKHLIKKIREKRPDLVVLYVGHNDYTRGYHTVRAHFTFLKGTLLKSIYKLMYPERNDVEAKIDFELEPLALNFLSEHGLFDIDHSRFPIFDEIIEKYLDINIRRISQVLQDQDIPLLLIPAVGNLHIPPIGQSDLQREHQKALKIDDYLRRLQRLNEIKDQDFHSPDIRARSGIKEIFSAITEDFPLVGYLDLEPHLRQREFHFSFYEFTDYFHFSAKGHQEIAKVLIKLIPNHASQNAADSNAIRNPLSSRSRRSDQCVPDVDYAAVQICSQSQTIDSY